MSQLWLVYASQSRGGGQGEGQWGCSGCGIGEIWVENCVRIAALILAVGAVMVFQISSVYSVDSFI